MNLKFAETRQVVWWNVVVSRALARICERERIDVVETPEYHAQGLLATLRQYRLPMIVRLHTPAFVCRELNGKAIGSTAWDTFASEKLEWWLAKRAAVVTSPSRQMAESVAGPWRMGVELIEVVPNPVDDDLFAPGARDGGEAVLLFVGRLERRKGVDTIARALPEIINKHPKARMQFVGNDHPSAPDGGSMQAWVRAYLREQGVGEDRVEFVGPVDRERLPAMYQRAAVCLVPSRYESFGYTCVEAMSCGCATVATRAGALAEIVTDERDGLLVEPDDAAALAQAVTRLLDDRALREGLGRAARETVVARFSRPAVCQQMVDVYLRTVRKSLSV
jgi:glycosyltransferase involved in cell wall biosynthesis